jgi:hypothetical protein
LSKQAGDIEALLTRFHKDRARAAQEIKNFWAERYTPERFRTDVRTFVFQTEDNKGQLRVG